MSYCINPKCQQRENSDNLSHCQSCGSELLINQRYRIVKPLRELNPAFPTDIFEVIDLGLGEDDWGARKVLKVLKYSNNPALVRLFQQEARVLMFLQHSGIPKVEPDGYFTVQLPKSGKQLYCLVMEFIEGENLADWIDKHGGISPEFVLVWLSELTNILDGLHSQNLLHRDIKPSNLLVRPNGQLALIDFGIVGVGEWGLTKVGTTGYAAPEQIVGEAVIPSDFFALGRTFVHLLTGRSPMDFPEDPKTGRLIWRSSVKGISQELADLIDDLMAAFPEKRPKNTRVILQRLQLIKSPADSSKLFDRKWILNSAKWGLVGALVVIFLAPYIFRVVNQFIIPGLDKFFTNLGTDHYNNSQFSSAESYYELALKFNPNNQAAEYSLGKICEEKKDFDCAISRYQDVINGSNSDAGAAAISSLARLQILSEDAKTVNVDLIFKGFKLTSQPGIQASLYKNLGWLRWEQNRIQEAEGYLKRAIAISQTNEYNYASPYCLLAQVKEAQKADASQEWDICYQDASSSILEEQVWASMARQRLRASGKHVE
ncbi:serine/threonine protein kinase with TPR repeats [Crinalium epipsammum PCC 9333]|uniref:non-specific serine/threonine protein kinase n=1 Tax=Crinalium epipsammum PCC 9333 TaxID=1173022 RepID=K9VVP0_9CYAN|nr:serine/threonine-protein kinase [Crinalium epipsammum]AFZ11542.1 serine/threonine protein kinase with TPR repeats [Crinalium epipsammum PCC 9333]